MTDTKNGAGNLLPMTVTEGLTVNVLPHDQHEYLMTTKEVANGYGVTEYAIRKNKFSLSEELVEGKHFVLAVTISNGELPSALRCAHNAVLWTKRGVIRLGFTMQGKRAKLFRDWAEELVIRIDQQRDLFNQTGIVKATPSGRLGGASKRNHNRLSPDRLLSIMADVCRIEDKELRISISNKLMMGGLY